MINYKCSKCGEFLETPNSLAGQSEACPQCGNVCVVPAPSIPAAPPPKLILLATPPPRAVESKSPSVPFAIEKRSSGLPLVGLWRQVCNDFRSAKRYLRARWRVRTSTTQVSSLEKQRNDIFREIGARTLELGLHEGLPASSSVLSAQARCDQVMKVLETQKASAKQAEDAMATEAGKRTAHIASVDGQYRTHAEAVRLAQQGIAAVEQEIGTIDHNLRGLQEAINAHGQGRPSAQPIDVLRKGVATYQQQRATAMSKLPSLQQRLREAASAADSKAAELRAANEAWSQLKAQLTEGARKASAEVSQTTSSLAEATACLGVVLGYLGKQAYEAKAGTGQLEQYFARVAGADHEMSQAESQVTSLQLETAANAKGAKRAAIYTGGALVTVMAVAIAIVFFWPQESSPSIPSPYAKIVGTWTWTTSKGDMEFATSYTADHKWTGKVWLKVQGIAMTDFSASGDWSIEGDMLRSTLKAISIPDIKRIGTVDLYRIIKVDDSALILQVSDETQTWRRRQ